MFKNTISMMALTMMLMSPSYSYSKVFSAGVPSRDIQVYQNTISSKPFKVIGKITVTAGSADRLREEMIKQVRKHGGDAVVEYKVLEAGSLPEVGAFESKKTESQGFQVGEQSLPRAEGVIIKYVNEGGTTELNDSVAVPVLN